MSRRPRPLSDYVTMLMGSPAPEGAPPQGHFHINVPKERVQEFYGRYPIGEVVDLHEPGEEPFPVKIVHRLRLYAYERTVEFAVYVEVVPPPATQDEPTAIVVPVTGIAIA